VSASGSSVNGFVGELSETKARRDRLEGPG
jgi:hypothetical protein